MTTYRCEFYSLDCGRKFFFCPLKITAPASLIPFTLQNFLSLGSLGYCPLPITPRRANLTMSNGEIFFIEYPFAASMPDWSLFWQELQQNSVIVNLQGIGESVFDNHLRSYLFL